MGWNQLRPKKKEEALINSKRKKGCLLLDRLKVAHDVAGAVEYLHQRRIIYRDLKSPNIGFDIRGDVKILDFGLARILPEPLKNTAISVDTPYSINDSTNNDHDQYQDQEGRDKGNVIDNEIYRISIVGTESYMAPEVRSRQKYGVKADVYSFGVLLWELLSLSTPLKTLKENNKNKNKDAKSPPLLDQNAVTTKQYNKHNNDDDDATDNGAPKKFQSTLPICPCWPLDLQNLLKQTLSSDYCERPSMIEILNALRVIIESCITSMENDEMSPEIKIDLTPQRRSTYILELPDQLLEQFNESFSVDEDNSTSFQDGSLTE